MCLFSDNIASLPPSYFGVPIDISRWLSEIIQKPVTVTRFVGEHAESKHNMRHAVGKKAKQKSESLKEKKTQMRILFENFYRWKSLWIIILLARWITPLPLTKSNHLWLICSICLAFYTHTQLEVWQTFDEPVDQNSWPSSQPLDFRLFISFLQLPQK